MGADLAPDAVLEGRDDLPARRVVLRVGGEDHADVHGETHRVALDLDVALLQDVEEADLDATGEVRQLVEGEDPPVGARQQAVVHGELAREVVASAGGPDGIHVADDVGDRHVRGGQLLDVALLGREPGDRRLVALLRHQVAAPLAERPEGVVVDLAARHRGQGGIEQGGQAAEEPALGLPAQAEEDHVVAGEDRVRDLRDHRLVVAEDAGEEPLSRLELAEEVPAHLLLHALLPSPRARQLAHRPWLSLPVRHCGPSPWHYPPLRAERLNRGSAELAVVFCSRAARRSAARRHSQGLEGVLSMSRKPWRVVSFRAEVE